MIKKLLATTLATLSIVSMSLPAMAVKVTDVDQEQHDNCLYSQQSNNNFGDFEVIEKDNEDAKLYEEKTVKAEDTTLRDNEFVEFDLNKDQKQAIKDIDKSPGYIAIRNNVKSLKQHVSNAYYAANRFDTSTTTSMAVNTIKDAAYIAGDAVCYPISGALRYAHRNGLVKKALDYGKDKLINYGLSYIGIDMKKDSNQKAGKLATAAKWGKSFLKWATSQDNKRNNK